MGSEMCIRDRKKVAIFRHARHQMDDKAKRLFYLSMVQSTAEYASNAYVHTLRVADYDRLVSACKQSLKIIFGYPFTWPTDFILTSKKLHHPSLRFHLKLLVFIFHCTHGLASPLLASSFTYRADTHHTNVCTRSQNTYILSLPAAHSRYGFFNLSYLAADRWNSLPLSIRSCTELPAFRALCFNHLGAS